MPTITRIPASVGNAEYVPIDGNVGITVFPNGMPGIFSCEDGTNAIAYGLLALEKQFGFCLDFTKVYSEHGLRPEWYQTALIYSASSLMRMRGQLVPFLTMPPVDREANPGQWARNVILSGAWTSSNLIKHALSAIDADDNRLNPYKTIRIFKALQDILDQLPPEQPRVYQQQCPDGPDGLPLMSIIDVLTASKDSMTTDGKWATMQIRRPALDRYVRSAVNALRPRPGFTGAFRYPLRAAIPAMDGRAFGQRKRVPGGSVLLDISGSMELKPHQIVEMLEARPALTIGAYGENQKVIISTSGKLNIIAAKGRIASKLPRPGGRNICDGPALEWLGKQKQPRIWISDGHVNGYTDNDFHVNLLTDALRIQRKYRIKRIPTIAAYLKASAAEFR